MFLKTYNQSHTLEEALKKMGRYCAYQDRCHQEVRQKLREMKMIPEAIDHIMAYLIEHDFLNEQRFSDSFTRGKFRIKHWGKNRIVRELKQREISPFIIRKSLKQISDQEYSLTLDSLARKRLQALNDKTRLEKKQKLASYLLYRGWENELVYDKISELLD
jgi:regulatory protein